MMLLLVLCCPLLCNGLPLELEHGFAANDDGENNTWKDVDLSRRIIKDPSYLLDRYPMGELPPDISTCRRPAKCVPLSKSTCMGTKLPYTFTTLDLISERVTQDIIEERLYLLQALKHVPKCWAVVQPFLCSIFMPKCINDTVELPSQEMCKMVSGPCRAAFRFPTWVHPGTQRAFRFLLGCSHRMLGGTFTLSLYLPERVEKPHGSLSRVEREITH